MLTERRHPVCDRPAPRALIFEHRMTVAEVNGLLMARRPKIVPSHFDADVGKKAEVALMRRQSVIAIVAILDQQFPIGARAVCLHAGNDSHPKFRLIGYQVQVLFCTSQIVIESISRRIEADEYEAAIVIDLGRLRERKLLALERWTVRVLARYSDQLSARVVRPRVIGTLKALRVSGFLTADERAAMRAGVEQDAH